MKTPISNIIKLAISIRLKEILDKNKDGNVSWKEIKTASLDDWMAIMFEVGGRALTVFEVLKFVK